MSNYIVTDTQLEDVADAIRAKSGGSSQLAFPAGFISEIGSIETGGGNSRSIVYGGTYTVSDNDLPSKLLIETKGNYNIVFAATYSGVGSTYDADLAGVNVPVSINMFAAGGAVTAIRKVTCDETPNITFTIPSGSTDRVFRAAQNLTEIHPLFVCRGSLGRPHENNGLVNLEVVKFKENASDADINWLGNSSKLTNDSLVSVANAMVATSPSTLTINETPKAKLSQITGTVSQKTEDNVTYDFFTADANGAVTLADFITNTKGWTIA